LVMKLSADLEVDGTTRQTRATGSQTLARSALTTYATAVPDACLALPILCYFGPTDCNLPQFSRAREEVCNGQTRAWRLLRALLSVTLSGLPTILISVVPARHLFASFIFVYLCLSLGDPL
jgi:hypothetical protein